jgi:hypothetical protein
MRIWHGYGIVDLVGAGKDAGWVIAMIVICITTFAVSSIFRTRKHAANPFTADQP